MNLTCARCGIVHTTKLNTYLKRLERDDQNPTFCRDCWSYPKDYNVDDLWQFVVTALRLNAR